MECVFGVGVDGLFVEFFGSVHVLLVIAQEGGIVAEIAYILWVNLQCLLIKIVRLVCMFRFCFDKGISTHYPCVGRVFLHGLLNSLFLMVVRFAPNVRKEDAWRYHISLNRF